MADIPVFGRDTRLLLFAPHPDDEALACGVILQKAVRRGAAIRVVYVTDGENNPWPQRFLERKWRLTASDRKRWGDLRRKEAMAALQELGVAPDAADFLGLPDQGLTKTLVSDGGKMLARLEHAIDSWSPTDILAPALSDTHPDHSAVGVALRMICEERAGDPSSVRLWNYSVHGRSPAFFGAATALEQSPLETAKKHDAISCHRTQIKLSRRRFFAYSARPEAFVRVEPGQSLPGNGAVRFVSRTPGALEVDLQARSGRNHLLILGRSGSGELRVSQHLLRPACTRIAVPSHEFSAGATLFVKFDRHSWYFDEAGWISVPPAVAGAAVPSFLLASA